MLPATLSPNRVAHLQDITASFLIGSALLLIGSLIRIYCFHQLGQMFTFDFIRKDHELITTGLYAYVRHPSYAGALLHFVGTLICHFSSDSWLRGTGLARKNAFVGLSTALYLFLTTWRIAYAFMRSIEEDKGLKKEFGAKWEDYSRRVRYRIIPGVF